MRIKINDIMKLNVCDIRKMPVIFKSNSGDLCIYLDADGKVYIEKVYSEVRKYLIYNIASEKHLFFVVKFEISDIGLIHGHVPDVDIYIAGSEKAEANEFFISRIKESLELSEEEQFRQECVEGLHK